MRIVSIKSRLLFSHLLIAVVAALVASIYLFGAFSRLQIGYHEKALLASAYALAETLETDFGTPHGRDLIDHAMRKASANGTAEFAVLDKRGRVVSSTTAITGRSLLDSPCIREALSGKTFVNVRKSADRNQERILVAVPMEQHGLITGAVRGWILTEDYEASLRPIRRVTILAVVGVAALSVALSTLLARALVTPIRRMRSLSRKIAGGDFVTRVEETGTDELGQLASDLNAMASRLQDLENTRRDFVGNVSHELRSPVSNIRITSEVLERRADRQGDDSADLFRTIIAETERLEHMIDELLELSAIKSGALTMQMEPFEARPCLEELVARMSPRTEQKSLTVGLLVDRGLIVFGDRERLSRSVSNLLDNAIKFTPSGGQIVLSAKRENGEVAIEVSDTGVGIAPEDIGRVFERFYRADRSAGGTGIGLAVVKHISEAHGGTVEAHSRPGHGSTFSIRIPSGRSA